MRATRSADDPLRWLLQVIALITCVSGLALVLLPGPLLDLLDAPTTKLARHEFAIVGMFMAVIGGLTAQAYADAAPPRYVVGWAAVQKLGAAVAVGSAVARDLFNELALLLAAFDLLTGVLSVVLWTRLGRPTTARRPVQV